MNDPRVTLPGSALSPEREQHWIAPADPNQRIVATIVLRRRASAAQLGEELLAGSAPSISREEAAQIGADPNDVAPVRYFAVQNGLKVIEENAAARTLRLEGTVQQMDAAFGVEIARFEDKQGQRFLSYQGTILVPESLRGIIVAVLGLDQRPAARHHAATPQ